MFTQIRAPMAAARRRAPLAVSVCRKRRRVVSRCNHAVRLELSERFGHGHTDLRREPI